MRGILRGLALFGLVSSALGYRALSTNGSDVVTSKAPSRLNQESRSRVRHAVLAPWAGLIAAVAGLWLAGWLAKGQPGNALEAWSTAIKWKLPESETPSSWIFGFVATGMALLLVTVVNDVGTGQGSELISANAHLLDRVGFGLTLGASGACWVFAILYWSKGKEVFVLAVVSAVLLGAVNALYGANPHTLRNGLAVATERRDKLRDSPYACAIGQLGARRPGWSSRFRLAGPGVKLSAGAIAVVAIMLFLGQRDDIDARRYMLVQSLMLPVAWWAVHALAVRDCITRAFRSKRTASWSSIGASLVVCGYASLLVWAFAFDAFGQWGAFVPALFTLLAPMVWWVWCHRSGRLDPWYRFVTQTELQRLDHNIQQLQERLGD